VIDAEDDTRGRESSRDPIAGFLSGVLLMIAGVLPVLSPVQLIAFVPLLLVLRRTASWRQRLDIGLLTGLGFVAPQVLLLRLPAPMALVLVAYFLALLVAFVCTCSFLVRRAGIWSSLAFGALLVVLDWVAITALPMWGTAQSFARPWSWYPEAIAFTSVTGITGIMFVLGVTQSLGVTLVLHGRHRVASLVGLIITVAIVAGVNTAVLTGRPSGYFKVAAVGWEDGGAGADSDPGTPDGFRRLCEEPVLEAARLGVRLTVFPETAFDVFDEDAPTALARFADLCREHGICVAVGYFNGKSQENRVAFLGPEGVLGRYTKAHLTPFENYSRGTGEPEMVTIDGVRIGAMICQDDNYTDISRRYGMQRADVLVVPTNDWGPVRKAHLQSTIHRAIESRFAIVRAASNGISAIISPHGERLASFDHWRHGPGMIVVDVPIYRVSPEARTEQTSDRLSARVFGGQTPYSRFGDWFVAACGVFLLAYGGSCCVTSRARRRSD
jgi:apolipoprotein N-acyltransferase